MKQIAYIFGTNHKYQFQDPIIDCSNYQLFNEVLVGYITNHGISGLAEECNDQALAENSLHASSVQILADKLSLPHRHCDPDRDTRDDLGIFQENHIRAHAFLHDTPEDQIRGMVMESYKKRESYWAGELLTFNVWPILFICGAKHVRSFISVLDQHGINGIVCEKDWGG